MLRHALREALLGLKREGSRVAGYGAAAKATTLMAYCGIDGAMLDYVVDLNSFKHGRFMPGNRLRILPTETLKTDPVDYLLILAWNFADEIMRQQQAFRDAGGRFIIPVPEPRVA
jgi:hypothetical protein